MINLKLRNINGTAPKGLVRVSILSSTIQYYRDKLTHAFFVVSWLALARVFTICKVRNAFRVWIHTCQIVVAMTLI